MIRSIMRGCRHILQLTGLERLLGRSAVIAIPYGWHIIFFLIPFLLVVRLSFSDSLIGTPPYTQLFSWVDESFLQIKLNLGNYWMLLDDELYISAYLESLKLAGIATIICLFIGYPMAYGISRASGKWRVTLLLLVILPFWTSFLLRVYAWIGILNNQGLINNLLMSLGVIDDPLPLINNDFAVVLGIVYSYLPFMVMPLYAALEKLDPSMLEAAYDLGCRPLRAFFTVTVPLSFRGVIAGSMLVFIPAVGEFVIPELLGGSDTLMIGKILWVEFFTNRDWPMASALAVALLVCLVLPIALLQKLISRQEQQEED